MSNANAELHQDAEADQSKRTSFKAMMAYAKPHKWAFAGIFFCSLLGISADLLQPYLVKIAIDDHLAVGQTSVGFLVQARSHLSRAGCHQFYFYLYPE